MYSENFSIKAFNSFKIDCIAKEWFSFESADELRAFLKQCDLEKEKHFVIGGGYNLLFKNKYYDGLLLHSEIDHIEVDKIDGDDVYLRVGSGVKWEDLIAYTIKNNWWGIENLSLIPGTVGAAPVQNIGAYGVEAKDTIQEVIAIDKSGETMRHFSHSDCQLAYRDSFFKHNDYWIITEVIFRLSKRPNPILTYAPIEAEFKGKKDISIQAISEFISQVRLSKLPDVEKIGNAGSFFKNPIVSRKVLESIQKEQPDVPFYALEEDLVKIPAGWLIESLNWKNSRNTKVGVYSKQALVIINKNEATGQDILAFSKEIQMSVKQFYNIDLEPEVILIE